MASPSTLVPPRAGPSRGPVPIPDDAHHRPHRYDRISPIARSLALAAAIVGTLEVVLHRTGAPVVSHVPGLPGGPFTAEAIRLTGRAALGATALLVLLLALALGLHLWKQHRLIAILLLVSVGAAIGRTSVPDSAWAAAAYALTAAAIAGVVVMAARSVPRLPAAAIGIAALGFMAGLYPVAAEAFVSSGLLSRSGGVDVGWRTFAELALVVSAVLFGIAALRAAPTRTAWWSAVTAGVVVATVLAFRPEYGAVLSLWALGVTLTLPPVVYIVGAAGFAAALTAWLATPVTRHRAAGITLLAVAGIAPLLLHHNVTLVVALVLLSMPADAGGDATEPSSPSREPETHPHSAMET